MDIFINKKNSREYSQEMFEFAVRTYKANLEQHLSPENMHRFHHGNKWASMKDDKLEDSDFELVSLELGIHYDDILKNDIQKKIDFIIKFIEGFTSQTMQKMYLKITESCDQVGNTINRNEYASDAEAFLEMIQKVEYSVDENGNVNRPQIHLSPDSFVSLKNNLASEGEVFNEKVDAIHAKKEKEALEKERQRKAKFKGLSNE